MKFEEAARNLEENMKLVAKTGFSIGDGRKHRWFWGIEHVECDCGVWRVIELPCWNHEDREILTVEAQARLSQSVRNLGYIIFKSFRLVK